MNLEKKNGEEKDFVIIKRESPRKDQKILFHSERENSVAKMVKIKTKERCGIQVLISVSGHLKRYGRFLKYENQ